MRLDLLSLLGSIEGSYLDTLRSYSSFNRLAISISSCLRSRQYILHLLYKKLNETIILLFIRFYTATWRRATFYSPRTILSKFATLAWPKPCTKTTITRSRATAHCPSSGWQLSRSGIACSPRNRTYGRLALYCGSSSL